jgi:hypothetical protein
MPLQPFLEPVGMLITLWEGWLSREALAKNCALRRSRCALTERSPVPAWRWSMNRCPIVHVILTKRFKIWGHPMCASDDTHGHVLKLLKPLDGNRIWLHAGVVDWGEIIDDWLHKGLIGKEKSPCPPNPDQMWP